MTREYRVESGKGFKLSDFDPDDTGDFKDHDDAEDIMKRDLDKLWSLQEKLYIDKRFSLLVVLQAMDTGGKDGTVKHVFTGANPLGCQVTAFKKPTPDELAHDYLWRIHRATPAYGTIGIFNRSHYEDVLVVRVHELVSKDEWIERYEQINNFEKMLTQENTIVVKFFLHISKDEQKKRLQERIDVKAKNWKFDPNDLKEREHWDDYMEAYEDAIKKCSSERAPWYVVPANKKWYRNLIVANVLVKTLEKIDFKLPDLTYDPDKIKIK